MPQSATPQRAIPDARESWIAPDAKTKPLLYVAEVDDKVYVYSYPGGKHLEGVIGGFGKPSQECVDKAGDVFVTDYTLRKIFEYPHGATSPSHVYDDGVFAPKGCSIDPVSGDLAVANWASYDGSRPGNVAIYQPPDPGAKRYVVDTSIDPMLGCTYDDHGNLYMVGGGNYGSRWALLLYGARSAVSLRMLPKILTAGDLLWDDNYLTVGDVEKNLIVRYSVSGKTAREAGATKLAGQVAVPAFWIQGSDAIAPDQTELAYALWKYPAGSKPFKEVFTDDYPRAMVVSTVPH